MNTSKELGWKDPGMKIQGSLCRSDGDIAAITYCYCGLPDPNDWNGTWPEGHYIEVNYYNYGYDQTFHLMETCVSDKRMDCLGHKWQWQDYRKLDAPTGREKKEYAQNEWGKGYREIQWNGACGYWSASPFNKNGYHMKHSPMADAPFYTQSIDKFCYWPNPGWHPEYTFDKGQSDRIYFNGQRRWLRDGQGFQDFADDEIRGICSKLCPEKTGLPIMPWDPEQVPSHQHCALDLDDMCKTCK